MLNRALPDPDIHCVKANPSAAAVGERAALVARALEPPPPPPTTMHHAPNPATKTAPCSIWGAGQQNEFWKKYGLLCSIKETQYGQNMVEQDYGHKAAPPILVVAARLGDLTRLSTLFQPLHYHSWLQNRVFPLKDLINEIKDIVSVPWYCNIRGNCNMAAGFEAIAVDFRLAIKYLTMLLELNLLPFGSPQIFFQCCCILFSVCLSLGKIHTRARVCDFFAILSSTDQWHSVYRHKRNANFSSMQLLAGNCARQPMHNATAAGNLMLFAHLWLCSKSYKLMVLIF